ncbi:hypothetical protein J2T55_000166 [Methylohalomonas lacus]|uniref:Uncharacterized protein n=1 Tax=Methylohalomonas lacus TaxID=398773 RepID=A0AAE3HJH6_9GAMM|nr:hypothetical protein [Methylohalomonas lacus]MCS3902174.1 hypothetical protein [Methylohalomonas lacus]
MADETLPKTLWSETQLDILFDALKHRRPDYQLLEILVDLRSRGFRRRYLLRKAEQQVGSEAVTRLKRLLGG